MQGPLKEDLTRMASRSSDKDLYKIIQGPLAKNLTSRSSCKDLSKRILPGWPQDLLTRTCTRSCKDLLQRTWQGSSQDLLIRTCARSCRKMSAGFSQVLLIRTCTRWCKCPGQDFIRISTRSSHKDLYKTLTRRAIRHAQSAERVARAHIRFHKKLCAPRKMNIENVKNDVLPRSQPLFWAGVYKVPRLPRKMTAKNTSHFHPRPSKKCHACHADEKVSDVLHLSRKTTFQTSKCPGCPTTDIAQKTSTAR